MKDDRSPMRNLNSSKKKVNRKLTRDIRCFPLCEHCDVVYEIVRETLGEKPAAVLLGRVKEKIHGEDKNES